MYVIACSIEVANKETSAKNIILCLIQKCTICCQPNYQLCFHPVRNLVKCMKYICVSANRIVYANSRQSVCVCMCVGLPHLFWVSVVAFVVDICIARILSSSIYERVYLILNYSTTTCSFWIIFSENCFREQYSDIYPHMANDVGATYTHVWLIFRQVAAFCRASACCDLAFIQSSLLYCIVYAYIPSCIIKYQQLCWLLGALFIICLSYVVSPNSQQKSIYFFRPK